jgi:tetratricopeptide (TPR) repeat protein
MSGQKTLSKNELRRYKIDSTFSHYEKIGFNTSGKLKYIYHFSDRDKEPLQELAKDLEEDSIEVVRLDESGQRWHLTAFENAVYTPSSMAVREQELRWQMFKFKVEDYNGFNIAIADIDFSGIADDVFYPFLLSLDNDDLFNVAMRLDKLKLHPKSLVAFDELIKRDFKPDTTYFKMGVALIGTHEYIKGIEHWQKATRINPAYLEVHMELGKLLFENSHWRQAYQSFLEANRLKPNDDVILYHLAKSLIKLERYNEAYDTIRRAIKLNRKNQYARGVLKYLKEPDIRRLRHANLK